ncbi:MAG: hypothetical protein AAFY10_09705 [Pseudomonadota bacterium]
MSEKRYDHDTLVAFVTGDLPDTMQREIETACETDTDLAAEIAVMRGVIEAQAARALEVPATEFGWARLSKAIDRSSSEAAKPQSSQQPRFALWQVAASAVAAVAIWQALAVPLLTRTDDTGAGYVPVSEATLDDTRARILFKGGTGEAEMRALLRDVDATIIAGPSAIGFYTVVFESAEARTSALVQLEDPESAVEVVQID